jgi:hypothetical protein
MNKFEPDFEFKWQHLASKLFPIIRDQIRARFKAGESLETIGEGFRGTAMDGADLESLLLADTDEKLKQWCLNNAPV